MTRRIITAREQVEMLSPWREAGRNGDLPEGLRFEKQTIGTPPHWTKAFVGDQEIGYLRPQPPKWGNEGENPTIGTIQVHPDYRRRGVGTAMLNWHRENVGPVDHSKYLTPNGRSWSRAQGYSPRKWYREPPMGDDHWTRTSSRTAVWREHPWLDDSATPTYTDPMDPRADIQEYLRGPEDAYDEYASEFGSWEDRVHNHPPIPTPMDVDWYHATFNDLPVGTVLAPHKGKVPWLDNPYHGGLDNRANWTWVEYDISHSDEWLGYMVRDHGEGHLYRVKPHIGPFPWNGDAREGWVTDVAIIVERVQDAGGQQRTAMPVVHHVTTDEGLEGIRQHGIEPRIGPRSEALGETQPGSYHFPSRDHMMDAVGNWMGEQFEDYPGGLHGVAVDVPNEWLEDSPAGYEKIVRQHISPDRIKGVEHLGAARTASDVDDILNLLGPSPGPPPPRSPRPPPDPDRYYKHLKQQEDRTHTAHAWLPTDVVDHYREYDRPTDGSDYQAVKRAVSEDGIKLPLWISANDTHGMLVEGNNRLKAAKELGIPHLPVRFTYNNPVMSNEGIPVPHHPSVAPLIPQVKARQP